MVAPVHLDFELVNYKIIFFKKNIVLFLIWDLSYVFKRFFNGFLLVR